jgi:hypothetical protein
MATKFVKGQEVKINAVIPSGPVQKLRMDEDGVFYYMVVWTDVDGTSQERWFKESDLIEA